MKIMLNVLLIAFLLVGCESITPKPKVNVYLKNDADSSKSNIIALPSMIMSDDYQLGSREYSNSLADGLFAKNWSDAIAEGNVIPVPKAALEQLPDAYAGLGKLLASMDAVSAIEQTTELSGLLEAVGSKFGDGAFAFALYDKEESQYKSSKSLKLTLGLFDVKKMTWAWITKAQFESPKVGPAIPYEVASQQLMEASFEELYTKKALKK